MKRFAFKTVTIFILLCIAVLPRSWAADFNIEVPVDLSRIPAEYTAVKVQCWAVCNAELNGEHPTPDSRLRSTAVSLLIDPRSSLDEGDYEELSLVGTGHQIRSIPASTGEFHEIVTVRFSAQPGYAPNNVKYYVCTMKLRDRDGKEYPEEQSDVFNIRRNPQGIPVSDFLGGDADTQHVFTAQGSFDNPAAAQDGNNENITQCRIGN